MLFRISRIWKFANIVTNFLLEDNLTAYHFIWATIVAIDFCSSKLMSTVKQLAKKIRQGLNQALSNLNKPVIRKLPLAGSHDWRANPEYRGIVEFTAAGDWAPRPGNNGWGGINLACIILWSSHWALCAKDIKACRSKQTDYPAQPRSNRLGWPLMQTVRIGDRSLPLAWLAEAGAAIMLPTDRFYPSVELFQWLKTQGWHTRLRWKATCG